MTAEYETLIAAHDRTLSMLRQCWQEAKGPEERSNWLGKINQALDDRIRFMKARDAAKITYGKQTDFNE